MIFYFSGTGNSKYVAKRIAKGISDDTLSINDLLKETKETKFFSQGKPFVFVLPTYAWRIPKVVHEFIEKATFDGSDKAYFVLTCGDDTGDALNYIKNLCKEKGWKLQGFGEVVMPANYIIMFKDVKDAEKKAIIHQANPRIDQIAGEIEMGRNFSIAVPSGIVGKLKSGIVNSLFYKMAIKGDAFFATDECDGCGACFNICPLNNIEMKEGRPSWSKNCTQCMGCIGVCPKGAIEYKKKTEGKERYFLKDDEM